MSRKSRALPPSPFRRFNSSPELIRQVVMLYIRCPLSLRNVEYLLFERGYDLCHETMRLWWNRFGPLFASEIRQRRVNHSRSSSSSCGESMALRSLRPLPSSMRISMRLLSISSTLRCATSETRSLRRKQRPVRLGT